ncbi:hypothetical protein COOONC_02223 [Cooperia oncophora]
MHTFLVGLILLPSVLSRVKGREERFLYSEVFDETVKTNPRSFDYDFVDDLRHEANRHDAYDEHVGSLPDFTLFKRGENRGATEVPVVTRGVHTWSTPAPNLDSFPYLTKSTPFGSRSTVKPSAELEQAFILNRQPVMLHADEVKRVRELLVGGSATTEQPKAELNTQTTTAPTTTTKQPEVKITEEKKPKDLPTLALVLSEPTIKAPVTKDTLPEHAKQAPNTEAEKEKKLKEVSPKTSTPTATTEAGTSASTTTAPEMVSSAAGSSSTTTAPATVSPAAETLESSTESKEETVTTSKASNATTEGATTSATTSEEVTSTSEDVTTTTETTTLTTTVSTRAPKRLGRPIWQPHRPAQPLPAFKFATVMGVRRERVRTTPLPRAGGIWRRGGVIIIEDSTTTSEPSTTTATTNKPTIAYLKERQPTIHRIDEKRCSDFRIPILT